MMWEPSPQGNNYMEPYRTRQLLKKSRLALLIGITALLACSDSTSAGKSVVGNYASTIFFSTAAGGSGVNEIQAGSSLTLNLTSIGATSGHLHIAANGSTPAFDADMAGTWTQSGETVQFTQTADTFVRNMVFTIQRISTDVVFLVSDQVVSGTRINLTLAREN